MVKIQSLLYSQWNQLDITWQSLQSILQRLYKQFLDVLVICYNKCKESEYLGLFILAEGQTLLQLH